MLAAAQSGVPRGPRGTHPFPASPTWEAAAGLDWPLSHGAALDASRPLDGLGECSIGRVSGRENKMKT